MKKIYLLLILSLTFTGIIKAQIINEGFEEAVWAAGGTGTSAGTAKTITVTTYSTTNANSTFNTGSWRYNSAYLVTHNAASLSAWRVNSGTYAMHLQGGSAAYIATPIIPNGVASVSFYMAASNSGTFMNVYANTNIGVTASTATSVMCATATNNTVGWTLMTTVSNASTNGYSQFAYTFTGAESTNPVILKFQRGSSGEPTIDDIMITATVVAPVAPTVTTTAPSPVGSTTASSGGNVTSDGGSAVTSKGVAWSLLANPKAYPPDTTLNGSGTGSFTSSITGLTPGTLYHVRAYAINGIDTAYGADLTFTTSTPTTDFYNVAGTDITVPGNWGTNANGSGTNPANFTTDGQVFHLSNTGGTMSGALTISGVSSKLIVENTFIASQTLIAPTDVTATGVLTIQSTTNPTFGAINTASTVIFDNPSANASNNNFGNLGLLNGAGLPTGAVGVFGTFSPGTTLSATTGNIFTFNGTAAQTAPSFIFDSLIINNSAGTTTGGSNTVVTANKGISILQNLTVAAGDTLKPKGTNGISYTVAATKALVVNGVLDNQSVGTVTVTGSITVNSGGAYKMNAPVGNSAGFIPTGTYAAGSDIIVLQGSPRIPQTILGNVTWSSTGTGSFLNTTPNTIGGNLTITNGQINNGSGGSGRLLTVSGNLTVSGGRYDVLGLPGSAATAQTLTVNGNVNVTGGKLFASAGNAGTGVGTINIKGDLVHTSGEFGDSNVVNTTGVIVFNGTANQNISSIGLSDTTSITINNPAGVTLLTDFGKIAGTLTFTSGLINTSANKIILDSMATTTGAGTGRYVNGIEEKYFKTGTAVSKTFEIGDATKYTPVDLTFASITGLGSITASTTGTEHPQIGSSQLNPSLSVNRYWTLTNGGLTFTTYNATFNFSTTPPSDVDVSADPNSFIIGEYDGSTWTYPTVGTLTPTSSQLTGNTGFSSFAIAEQNLPLPIKLEFLNGNKATTGNSINWKVNCTSTSLTMQVERSTDAQNFGAINSITASQARCGQPFNFVDADPLAGTNYYRLKFIDIDGKISYSATVAILNNIKGIEISIYPSVIRNNEASISIVTNKAINIGTIITDMNGKVVKTGKQSLAEGTNLLKLDCLTLAKGVYNFTSTTIDGKLIKTIRFIKL